MRSEGVDQGFLDWHDVVANIVEFGMNMKRCVSGPSQVLGKDAVRWFRDIPDTRHIINDDGRPEMSG